MNRVTFDNSLTDKDKDMIAVLAGQNNMSIDKMKTLIADNMSHGKIIWNKKMRNLFNQHPKPFVKKENGNVQKGDKVEMSLKEPYFKDK